MESARDALTHDFEEGGQDRLGRVTFDEIEIGEG
jgi:hypothetical protein